MITKSTIVCLEFICFALSLSGTLRAQNEPTPEHPDSTLQNVEGDTVVVIGEASSVVYRSVQPMSYISEEAMSRSGARNLAEVLSSVPGLFVRQYGGVAGQQSMSLRGSPSANSIVTLNGVRLRSSAESGFDAGTLPTEGISSIKVTRGGNGVAFGSNAQAGSIEISSFSFKPENWLTLKLGAGSFGDLSAGLSYNGFADDIGSVRLSLDHSRSEGDYSFQKSEFGEEEQTTRSNSDFERTFAGVSLRKEISSSWRVRAFGQGYQIERGVPGAVVQGNEENLAARLKEKDILGSIELQNLSASSISTVMVYGRENWLNYVDSNDRSGGIEGVDASYILETWGAKIRNRSEFESISFNSELEIESIALEGENIDPATTDEASRDRIGVSFSAGWSDRVEERGSGISLRTGVRTEFVNGYSPQYLAMTGLSWQPLSIPLSLKTSFSRDYRLPSFTELYYLNVGNSLLKPERSTTLNVGASYLLSDRVALDIGLFRMSTKDEIVTIPMSPVRWSTLNIGKTFSRGLELFSRTVLVPDLFTLEFAYTLMESVDASGGVNDGQNVPYAPNELIYGSANLTIEGFRASCSFNSTSYRETLRYNTPESALGRYTTFDVHIDRGLCLGELLLKLNLDVRNLLDESYQVIRNYPMPARSIRFGLSSTFSLATETE